MTTATVHIRRGWLWFAIVAAPLAWGVQEAIGWYLSSAPCQPYTAARALDGNAGWVSGVMHVLLIAVAALALVMGVAGWRRTRPPGVEAAPVDHFLATIAMVVSAVGLLALVWGALGTVMLPACETLR